MPDTGGGEPQPEADPNMQPAFQLQPQFVAFGAAVVLSGLTELAPLAAAGPSARRFQD